MIKSCDKYAFIIISIFKKRLIGKILYATSPGIKLDTKLSMDHTVFYVQYCIHF